MKPGMKAATRKRFLWVGLLALALAWPLSRLAAHAVVSYRLSHGTLTAATCPLHHERLHRGWVRVEYGDISKWNEYCQAREDDFPNANSVWFGGCMVGREGEIHEVVWCDQCRRAERAWERRHGWR